MQDHFEKQIEEQELGYEPVFVARQPIFTAGRDLWGYELLFRHSGVASGAVVSDAKKATASVITDGFTIASESSGHGKKFLVNFPEELLLDGSALAMPRDNCIPEVLENVTPSPEVVKALKTLKREGYLIAIDDFVGQPGFEPLLEIADIIKVEVLGMDMGELIALSEGLADYKAQLLAEKVEDKQTFDLTKALGYTFYQGYFFSKPEIIPGRKVSSSVMAKLNLLKELADENVTPQKLSDLVSTDPSLSFRLMRFINSSAFSFMKHISSISHAITLMGIGSLKKWLMLIFITDLDPSPLAQDLALKSIQRAKFLEAVAKECTRQSKQPDTLFMLGLFSHLDVLLGMDMHEVTHLLPLDDDIKAALNGEKNPTRVWLMLVKLIEEGEWAKVERILEHHGLDRDATARLHSRAGLMAKKILGFTTG